MEQMTETDQATGRMQIARHLVVHFCLWWAANACLWIVGFGWTLAPLMAPVAPILMGPFYLQLHELWQVGLFSAVVSTALMVMTWFSLRKQTRWIVYVTHFVIVAYWVMSFLLIGATV